MRHNRCAEIQRHLQKNFAKTQNETKSIDGRNDKTPTRTHYCIVQAWGGRKAFGVFREGLPDPELARWVVQPLDLKLDATEVVNCFAEQS
mmetsp:Transcript_14055/g.34818  ORF Transcript_14055/g.34818 Transcript_14055/m.34818 type:complete len:90 (-) Transcript_14055:130-399(-)